MHKGRNRHKKVRKPKQKKSDKEVYDDGWMRIERDGKNVFIRNAMTEQQHASWLKQLKTNRPLFYLEIRQRIEKLIKLIDSYDKIFVLGGISSYALQRMTMDENDDGISEVALEYCQSIATVNGNTHKGIRPNAGVLKEIYELLVQVKRDIHAYYAIEHLEEKYSKIESDIRFKMIGETLFVRGDGYLLHIEELFLEMFSPHDSFFLKHYGFKSADIISTFKQLESSFHVRVALPNAIPGLFFLQKLNEWERNKSLSGEYPEDFIKNNPDVAVENGKPICYPLGWLEHHEKLFRIRFINETQEKVVKSISMRFGSNLIFAKYSSCEPINESDIFQAPIVEVDEGMFYLFSMNIGARNYFNIAQDLIKKVDLNYYNQTFCSSRSLISRDLFIERKVLELFKRMLPKVEFYPNVRYQYKEADLNLKCAKAQDDMYELDILGISENATYVIEVKAGAVEKGSKRGAIKTVKSDLRKIIGDAICQSYRAFRHIIMNDNSFFSDNEGNRINKMNRNKVFRISVSFSYVGSIISSLNKLKEFGVIDDSSDYAWAINIFDLMPFTELISSEAEFIDYLSKRLPMYEDKRLENLDEMNMLGLYFENDLKIDSVFDDSNSVMLNGYKDEIDQYFQSGGKKPVKKPVEKRTETDMNK